MSDQNSMSSEEYKEYQRTGVLPIHLARQKVTERAAPKKRFPAPTPAETVRERANQEPKAKRDLEEYLFFGGWGRVQKEWRFHPRRNWLADWYLMDQDPPIIIEYDGLMHHGANQGHASINGILRDTEKINEATRLGIRVFRTNAKHIESGLFFELMNDVLRKVKP